LGCWLVVTALDNSLICIQNHQLKMVRSRRRNQRERCALSNSDDSAEEVDAGEGSPGPSSGPVKSREEAVNTLDPIISGLRTSMDNLVQLVKDILPTCETGKIRKLACFVYITLIIPGILSF